MPQINPNQTLYTKRMTKNVVVWAHHRSSSTNFIRYYCNDHGLKINSSTTEPLIHANKFDSNKMKDESFKVIAKSLFQIEPALSHSMKHGYHNIILFRRDLYASFLSLRYLKLMKTPNFTPERRIDWMLSKLPTVDFSITSLKKQVNTLDWLLTFFQHFDITYEIVETQDSISYMGRKINENRKFYSPLENEDAKNHLTSHIDSCKILKEYKKRMNKNTT